MVAALSAQEVQGAKFRERVRQAGGLVVGDESEDKALLQRAGVEAGARRPPPRPDERPGYIEIDIGADARVLVLRHTDGRRIVLHPFLSYKAARTIPFYVREMANLQAEMEVCHDKAAWMGLRDQWLQFEDELTRLSIPDLPEGLLQDLGLDDLEKVREARKRMEQQSEAANSPN